MSSIQERQFSKKIGIAILVACLTVLAGEIKIVPFDDTTFRFGLGSIVFFLCILVLNLPVIATGFLTACIIIPFRALISTVQQDAAFNEQLILHVPAAIFYIMYSLSLSYVPLQKLKNKPFYLIAVASICEFIANCVEQFSDAYLFDSAHLQPREITLLFTVAIFRSLFAVGLFSLISLSEQKKQTEQLLSIGSNLYTESLYVKKMMEQIEGITKGSFKLHQHLRASDRESAIEALMLSQNMHEVKKDLERVYAGLSKIVLSEQENSYYFDDLLHLVSESNNRYSKWLQKDITIQLKHVQNFSTKEPFLLLSILNNIVANAIEAIDHQGIIIISSINEKNKIILQIENDGPAIDPALLAVIFDAGYTTKFNKDGVASTGIGLNHVKTLCEKIDATINVESGATTIFTVTIPSYKLLQ